jgi:hypothetical protein
MINEESNLEAAMCLNRKQTSVHGYDDEDI